MANNFLHKISTNRLLVSVVAYLGKNSIRVWYQLGRFQKKKGSAISAMRWKTNPVLSVTT